jgi:hypothetical protein
MVQSSAATHVGTSSAGPSGLDRRTNQRSPLSLPGRFMRADKLDYPCRIENISIDGAAVVSPAVLTVGERIIAYILHLGGIEGSVVRRFDGGFAMAFTATQRKRDKLAAQIWRLKGADIAEAREEREHLRAPGDRRLSLLLLPDGTALECPTLDISQCGASIVTPIKPALGSEVIFANRPAAVVRHHDDGIAIEFVNDAFTDGETRPRYVGDLQA